MSIAKKAALFGALAVVGVPLTACGESSSQADNVQPPARLENIAGSSMKRVILSARAAERLDIKTVGVKETRTKRGLRKEIPYLALIYDEHGATFAYSNPDTLQYVRVKVVVDRIEGKRVFLSSGPAVGVKVVTVGVAELFGTEFGVEEVG